jgi:hypothetical protein
VITGLLGLCVSWGIYESCGFGNRCGYGDYDPGTIGITSTGTMGIIVATGLLSGTNVIR